MRVSPCVLCTRVSDPKNCENKNCPDWRSWWLGRWDLIHRYPRDRIDRAEVKPAGVPLGGRHYTTPQQATEFLEKDPCDGCLCPKDLCSEACKLKRAWTSAKAEVC